MEQPLEPYSGEINTTMTHTSDIATIFSKLGLELPSSALEQGLEVVSPIDSARIGVLPVCSTEQARQAIGRISEGFKQWRTRPAPVRGQVVRIWVELVRKHKPELAQIITLEAGKIVQESLGEVQEVIDICDFAIGLSRQLYGLTIASERPKHKLLETWHPFGPTGVITAFNFPMAVFAWNAALALVCGNTIAWKPSEKTPYCALALHGLLLKALKECGENPDDISTLLIGGPELGEILTTDDNIKLVSATGSTRMGLAVAQACAARFKRSLLELGGNNAAIVCPSADIELVTRASVFAAAGTAGQRCTTLRRLIVHRSIHNQVLERIKSVYERLPVGDPRVAGTLVGPLIDARSFAAMQQALTLAQARLAKVNFGERVDVQGCEGGYYVRPAIVEMPKQEGPMMDETFAPILYVVPYDTIEEAIELNNAVAHGLSSAIFTRDLLEAELFTSAQGSDCGIANVNIGTSGAEIGGAFGGEKHTGGGRESGSDAWKSYMRRATNTINYGTELPLAQGVKFDI